MFCMIYSFVCWLLECLFIVCLCFHCIDCTESNDSFVKRLIISSSTFKGKWHTIPTYYFPICIVVFFSSMHDRKVLIKYYAMLLSKVVCSHPTYLVSVAAFNLGSSLLSPACSLLLMWMESITICWLIYPEGFTKYSWWR